MPPRNHRGQFGGSIPRAARGIFAGKTPFFFKEREFSPQHAEYVRECVVAGLRLFPGEDAQWLLL
jgi:hypothetical protein